MEGSEHVYEVGAENSSGDNIMCSGRILEN